MSVYRSELATNGVAIYTEEYNEDLFNVLESMYDGYEDLTDFEYLKVIYSELSDEVDDEDYYDLGVDEDNHDLINLILDYCLKYEVNKTLFALNIGKYLIQKEDRQFKSYEDFHQAIAQSLKDSTELDHNNQYIFLAMHLNDIIAEELNNALPEDGDDDY